ncbi:MarC family protein [Geomonas azotofigens]|uniref:MarC family protein n=1 Tax=Geomonas azotofigens TaxID=2843196 RepID=UPI001C125A87|nr:MarC family protein [Geomonas azotofigens]MBU5614987.1 MarC family protein [Geomonas azotofigens]
MNAYSDFFFTVWIRFFFLLTPFFVLSTFLAMTPELTASERRSTALRVTLAVLVACFVLYSFGNTLFSLFGITLDSFRIGAGSLLFLSAVHMVHGDDSAPPSEKRGAISVVPLAIPVTVGPGTTGALLVMGAEVQHNWQVFVGLAALAMAVLCVGILLVCASFIEHIVGKKGITILSKLTGLFVAALAAQIVFTGVRNFLKIGA